MTERRCPICTRPAVDAAFRPFCSRRCADVDLQRWFSGAYAVPVVEPEEDPSKPIGQAAGRPEDDLL